MDSGTLPCSIPWIQVLCHALQMDLGALLCLFYR